MGSGQGGVLLNHVGGWDPRDHVKLRQGSTVVDGEGERGGGEVPAWAPPARRIINPTKMVVGEMTPSPRCDRGGRECNPFFYW